MATTSVINGYGEPHGITPAPTSYLGKRKRTLSPETHTVPIDNHAADGPNPDLQRAFEIIEQHVTSQSILHFPLYFRVSQGRSSKRQKKNDTNDQVCIEDKIRDGAYHSLDELIEDLRFVNTSSASTVNGHDDPAGHCDDIIETLSRLRRPSRHLAEDNDEPLAAERYKGASVLSLRSQTEAGVKQLFSGLPSTDAHVEETVKRKLPNGFEFAEASMLDVSRPTTFKSTRTFGDTFAAHHNLKSLEKPEQSRRSHQKALDFIAPFQTTPLGSKPDYKYASLDTAAWLQYSTTKFKPQPSETRTITSDETTALFKSTFSSFAPVTDHSASVVTTRVRSDEWLRKHVRTVDMSAATLSTDESAQDVEVSPDFENLMANFVAETDLDDRPEAEKMLDEVGELLETLSSHQAMRDSDVAQGPTSAPEPTKAESDIHEMLRMQLQLLVDSLPPHLVAKLNGDQLESLNISTTVRVAAVDFSGTAQPDEYTLRRHRATQPAPAAARVNTAPIPPRQSYTTPAAGHNTPSRPYSSSLAPTTYSRPNTTAFTAARPAVPAQSSYGQTGYRNTSWTTPSVQQFQRPANGYVQNTSQGTPNVQRPTQPGYQQRAQDNGSAYLRNDFNNSSSRDTTAPRYPLTIQQQQRLLAQQRQEQEQNQHQMAEQRMSNDLQPANGMTNGSSAMNSTSINATSGS